MLGWFRADAALCLAAETLQGLRILGEIFRKKFQRDKTAEAGVFGFVDHAHPATAELFKNSVMRDGLVEQEGPGSPGEPS